MLCLRFAWTGRGFAWKEKDTLEHSMVIIRRDKRRRKKDRGTKDLPGLSLYISPVFPMTHGTQMKTDFKGEDENLSLL